MPELQGIEADTITAKAAGDYPNHLIASSTVTIQGIDEDRSCRTVAKTLNEHINIQEQLVEKGFTSIYERYSSKCEWSKK